jgi:ABC-type transport system involved in multi-copper enzyme maturation permease subunit
MEGIARYWEKHAERSKLAYKDREAARRMQMPAFSYPSETTVESFVATLPQLVILMLLGLIFYALTYTSFLRKDVR